MTTYISFAQSALAPFQFQAQFTDFTGSVATYSVLVTWNYYGQRFYVNVTTPQGQTVYTLPLVPSPDEADININGGYFETSLVYRQSTNNFEIK